MTMRTPSVVQLCKHHRARSALYTRNRRVHERQTRTCQASSLSAREWRTEKKQKSAVAVQHGWQRSSWKQLGEVAVQWRPVAFKQLKRTLLQKQDWSFHFSLPYMKAVVVTLR